MSDEDRWVESRSDEEIKAIAIRSRSALCKKQAAPVDIIACLGVGKILTSVGMLNLKYVQVADIDMDVDDANTELIEDVVVIKAKISVHRRAVYGDGRAKMTLAHELAHAVLHPGVIKSRRTGATGRPNNSQIPPHRSAEHQAKVFASAFLIYREFASQLESAERISEEFSISLEAARICFNEFQAEKEKLQSFALISRIAQEFKDEIQGSSKKAPNFLAALCPSCGQQKLTPIGIKYYCYNCENTSDALQDGDGE